MHICIMGTMGVPHVQYGPGLMKKGRKEGGGGFSAQFSGMFNFSIHSYNRDLRCSKCIT